MLKTGLLFMFGTATHLLFILMWGQYMFAFYMTHGGVGGTPINNIPAVYWVIIVIEFLISVTLMVTGLNRSRKET